MSASDAYDVIVIGAGAGGMTAAAVAAAEGVSVLLIEKTEFVGGTTSWSGGMVWIPVNASMKQAGLSDTPSEAADYLASAVPEIENAELRQTFLARGPEAVEYLEAHTEVRLQPVKAYPDYYPEKPGATAGGRVLEPVTFDGARLGVHFMRLRPPLPEFTLFGGMMVHTPPAQGRALVSFDPAIGAPGFSICAATPSRAPGYHASSRQRAGGAALRVTAGAKRRCPVRRQRQASADRRRRRSRGAGRRF
jgi:hypothetical protein